MFVLSQLIAAFFAGFSSHDIREDIDFREVSPASEYFYNYALSSNSSYCPFKNECAEQSKIVKIHCNIYKDQGCKHKELELTITYHLESTTDPKITLLRKYSIERDDSKFEYTKHLVHPYAFFYEAYSINKTAALILLAQAVETPYLLTYHKRGLVSNLNMPSLIEMPKYQEILKEYFENDKDIELPSLPTKHITTYETKKSQIIHMSVDLHREGIHRVFKNRIYEPYATAGFHQSRVLELFGYLE